jgi:hypothetical protein
MDHCGAFASKRGGSPEGRGWFIAIAPRVNITSARLLDDGMWRHVISLRRRSDHRQQAMNLTRSEGITSMRCERRGAAICWSAYY